MAWRCRSSIGVGVLLVVSVAVGGAGCAAESGNTGDSGSAETGDEGPSMTGTSAAEQNGSAGHERHARAQYRKSPSAHDKLFTLQVDKIIDPAKASAPWGGGAGTNTHNVAFNVTLRANNPDGGGAVNASCFSAKDSDGAKAELAAGMRTKGAHPIEGMMDQASEVSGQVVFEVRDGARLAELVSSCGANGKDTLTARLLQ